MERSMSLKDVARLLGVKAYRVQYAIVHENVPEPQRRMSGRRVFEPEDVERLAAHFHVALPETV
jgi:DNA-binding transcriptional MerR regulator